MVVDQIYARLGALLEPTAPHKLAFTNNMYNIPSTIKLMRSLANRLRPVGNLVEQNIGLNESGL